MENITGSDLIAAGFEAGPELGAALTRLNTEGLGGSTLQEWVHAGRILLKDSC